MVSLVFLGLAIVCALISRILLLIAAIDISAWWALGVFLPLGPLFFRLNYPEQARNSYLFRVATLLCIFGFVEIGRASCRERVMIWMVAESLKERADSHN